MDAWTFHTTGSSNVDGETHVSVHMKSYIRCVWYCTRVGKFGGGTHKLCKRTTELYREIIVCLTSVHHDDVFVRETDLMSVCFVVAGGISSFIKPELKITQIIPADSESHQIETIIVPVH